MKKLFIFLSALFYLRPCSADQIPPEAEKDLKVIYQMYRQYKEKFGNNPKDLEYMIDALSPDEKSAAATLESLENPDFVRPRFEHMIDYMLVASSKTPIEFGDNPQDIVASMRRYDIWKDKTETGGQIYLMGDGNIVFVPFDLTFSIIQPDRSEMLSFPGQKNISWLKALSYEERLANDEFFPQLPVGKSYTTNKTSVPDNGGPESLVRLSRRFNFPTEFGLSREQVWDVFDPSQPMFSLQELQVGAEKLGFKTQVKTIGLDELQKLAIPAILILKDNNRIITLTALDDGQAAIIDRGRNRVISRALLEQRYSGEALVKVGSNAAVVADDGVREIVLKGYGDVISQQVVLRNVTDHEIKLQLDSPLLGVSDFRLSKETLAPNETATLDLKMKWRLAVKTPRQNVLVSVGAGEGQPRLQLAFSIVPPLEGRLPGLEEADKLARAEDMAEFQIAPAKPTVLVGQAMPDFTATDMNGKVWSLAELKGKKNLLLTFFPKCFTGGCANHLSSLRDRQNDFEDLNTQILAVSVDEAEGEKGQKAFAAVWKLTFPMIPDPSRNLSKLFGAAQNSKQLSARMSILIDKTGVVRFIDTDVRVQTHGADMVAKIRELALG